MTVIAGTVTVLICAILTTLILIGVRDRAADYRRQQAGAAALQMVFFVKQGEVPPRLRSPRDVAIQVLDARGRIVAATPDLEGEGRMARFVPGRSSVYAVRELCPPAGFASCMDVLAFRVFDPRGDWIVYAAAPATPWYVNSSLVTVLLSMSVLVTLLACLRTWGTVDRTLVPVDAIRAELTEITAKKSGRRVTVPENRDEVRRLAEAVNATLDRLDAALERQRSFTSDASHDLRSPIAAARAQMEEALMYPDEVDWPQAGRTVLQNLDRLQAIVTDLLELARLDATAWRGDEIVDLGAMVTIELARSERSKQVVPHILDDVTVRGDRLRLVRLFTNLLDNAERHAESRIDVSVWHADGEACLEVLDDGAGITVQDREKVFERFARLQAGRQRDAGGTGLGLPIAREIARAHGGDLTIEDSARGARFVLRVPHEKREEKGEGKR
ncbi:sensor histidine kinase [Actinomadura sp. WAC 06369]|uniref:sensor histidine kinase n=1 Tax=Actinomadura sp. WAC 06369 TaxID=2203193 RepID=UPI000F781DDA|nr:HAMP domain-containing sensor histidine kinase [Actinomadura sp. WAC 06369]RSN46963.1 sensor histidine kinase [Actinomadura sp. WAC 06369]